MDLKILEKGKNMAVKHSEMYRAEVTGSHSEQQQHSDITRHLILGSMNVWSLVAGTLHFLSQIDVCMYTYNIHI